MKTPTIDIHISGPQGSGKSQFTERLIKLLAEHPFQTKGIQTPRLAIHDAGLPKGVFHIDPPAPATVPLGENVTRDGLRARVICNDYQQNETPVVAAIQITQGSRAETIHRYDKNGRHPSRPNLDLVGHTYHEIQPPKEDSELEDLRRGSKWVTPLLQEIGEEMGLKIGDDIGSKILPYIRSLKSRLDRIKRISTGAAEL